MKKIFIDTSVLYSACESRTGASAKILQLSRQDKIQGYISKYVIDEIKRNVSMKLNQIGKQRLNFYMLQTHLSIAESLTNEEIIKCEKVINEKDAPILAAALKSKVNFLITLNTNDFMQQRIKKFAKTLKIMTPRDFIKNKL